MNCVVDVDEPNGGYAFVCRLTPLTLPLTQLNHTHKHTHSIFPFLHPFLTCPPILHPSIHPSVCLHTTAPRPSHPLFSFPHKSINGSSTLCGCGAACGAEGKLSGP